MPNSLLLNLLEVLHPDAAAIFARNFGDPAELPFVAKVDATQLLKNLEMSAGQFAGRVQEVVHEPVLPKNMQTATASLNIRRYEQEVLNNLKNSGANFLAQPLKATHAAVFSAYLAANSNLEATASTPMSGPEEETQPATSEDVPLEIVAAPVPNPPAKQSMIGFGHAANILAAISQGTKTKPAEMPINEPAEVIKKIEIEMSAPPVQPFAVGKAAISSVAEFTEKKKLKLAELKAILADEVCHELNIVKAMVNQVITSLTIDGIMKEAGFGKLPQMQPGETSLRYKSDSGIRVSAKMHGGNITRFIIGFSLLEWMRVPGNYSDVGTAKLFQGRIAGQPGTIRIADYRIETKNPGETLALVESAVNAGMFAVIRRPDAETGEGSILKLQMISSHGLGGSLKDVLGKESIKIASGFVPSDFMPPDITPVQDTPLQTWPKDASENSQKFNDAAAIFKSGLKKEILQIAFPGVNGDATKDLMSYLQNADQRYDINIIRIAKSDDEPAIVEKLADNLKPDAIIVVEVDRKSGDMSSPAFYQHVDSKAKLIHALRQKRMKNPVVVLLQEPEGSTLFVQSVIRLLGFGADRVVSVPTAPKLIESYIRALALTAEKSAPNAVNEYPPFRFHWNYDGKTLSRVEVVAKDGRKQAVHFTGSELSMLELLAHRKGSLITKEMFLNHVYGGVDEPNMKIIDVFICKIRKRFHNAAQKVGIIEPQANELVSTVWGRGYILNPNYGHDRALVSDRRPQVFSGPTPGIG